MGVFDSVMVPCPVCGYEAEFQSKSGECILRVYDLADAPEDVMFDVNRHSPYGCYKCGAVFRVDKSAGKAVLVSAAASGEAARPAAVLRGNGVFDPPAARPGWDDYFAEMAVLASRRSTCNARIVSALGLAYMMPFTPSQKTPLMRTLQNSTHSGFMSGIIWNGPERLK